MACGGKMKSCVIKIGLLTMLFLACRVRASMSTEMERNIMESILDPQKYNPAVRAPGTLNSTGPVVVKVNTYVRSLNKLDDINRELSVQLTFRQAWKDASLSYMKFNETKYISIDNPAKIWTPDTFFSNEKSGHFHNIVKPNVLIRITPDGEVLYSTRISLKLSCPMDLTYFPMDSQTCSIIIASYAYTTTDLVYRWKLDDPVQITKNVHLLHFELEKFYTSYCTSRTTTGEYSCVKIDFHFRREFSYYFPKVYLPTIIFVMMSWLCFWVDPIKTTARVFIWMACFLAFAIKLCSFNSEVPTTDYQTVYDTWTTTCLAFLVAVIFETVLITIMFSEDGRKTVEEKNSEDNNFSKKRQDSDDPDLIRQTNVLFRLYHTLLRKYSSPEQKIDFLCRILFPLAFALFNVFYWCGVVQKSD